MPQGSQITDSLKLAMELSQIYESIKPELDKTQLLAELDYRCQWLARSGELIADAQYILDCKRGQVADKNNNLSATLLREVIARDCAEENRLYKLADRLNATLTHQIDALRTMISFEKESMRNSR